MSQNTHESPKTLSVPAAGKLYFDLCPRSSYEAVARGEIPVIRIGRLLRVPVKALEAMLEQAGTMKPVQLKRAGDKAAAK